MLRALHISFWLGIVVALSACGGLQPSSNEPNHTFLSLGTAPPGGAFFVVGSALAEVLNTKSDDLYSSTTAEATSGSQENIRRLVNGELDFALSNSAITYFAVRGLEGWDHAYPVRTMMTLAPNVALFITSSNSGVVNLANLKGKRVVVGPAGAGFGFFIKPLLAAHDLSYEDFSPLYATQQAAVDMLTDGSAAAAFLGGAVPTASITQASMSQDILFLPFDEKSMEQLIKDYLFFRPAIIPAKTYRGQTEDFHGLDVGSMHLVTTVEQSQDLVYNVTKILYENREQVVERHPAGRAINSVNAIRDTGTKFHPGAVRYYKEIGIWLD